MGDLESTLRTGSHQTPALWNGICIYSAPSHHNLNFAYEIVSDFVYIITKQTESVKSVF